jgi:uncharacterized membrane protein
MTPYVFALLIGVVAGMRSMTAPAVVSWAAYLGWLDVQGTWAAFLAYPAVPYVLSALAILELIGDQLPATPSRTAPVPFAARIISGAFCGAVFSAVSGDRALNVSVGALGAVIGTLGGHALRARLAQASGGRDRPAALLEDAIALGAAFLSVTAVS